MSEISHETVVGKLNSLGHGVFIQSLRLAKSLGNRNLELAHILHCAINETLSDISFVIDDFKLDRSKIVTDVQNTIDGFRKNVTEMPAISDNVISVFDRSWHYSTLLFGEVQIRTGHMLLSSLKTEKLARVITEISPEFAKVSADQLASEANRIWAQSDEENLRPIDGSSLSSGATSRSPGEEAPRGNTALARFSVDLTEAAASGSMDPIVGRDEEIRQIIDVLMRRRQNNPILTGEAGVGKTAVVEGFAQCIASGDVPPQLQGVRLHSLDIGLMQAGASMKGEFEQRLRSVIDEVQSSPEPIIMFIDEAHTLIGAGGAEGTGDAANLLKPALARGTLRTIGATTWAEYRKYFEKDPALTRRFQPVEIEEPSIEKCCYMLRGILTPMEKHHGVRISDAAIVQAVQLSSRYIPARQLPDKAVSLLDTACARVAISQTTTPAKIADLNASLTAIKKETEALEKETDLGRVNEERLQELAEETSKKEADLETLQKQFEEEQGIIEEITALRKQIAKSCQKDEGTPEYNEQEPVIAHTEPSNEETEVEDDVNEESDIKADIDDDALAQALSEKVEQHDAIDADDRMIHPHVDEQAVASVVSDWTGIPVGKMVKDEVEVILKLSEHLTQRVIGQDHGLNMIAKRIETNRAKLDNPNKPIGVFMLCGPSGVGKTETALALAETLYGGEQNIITINMSEFQEAHTVSLLKGAPPGYVGYGEGGRLTEAVRRKPYSVVLLDEVEKAHPDVHELFFQVFDKGIMEDGSGRIIDFKNTLIILTSNVGTEVIMNMAEEGKTQPDPDELNTAIKPYLTDVFPPALLGRIVTIPYFPLSGDMLKSIIRLQLGRIVSRIAENHNAEFIYSDAVVDHITSQCKDPDSGGRMIDNIITNSLLPSLSRHFLNHSLENTEIETASVDMKDGEFVYEVK